MSTAISLEKSISIDSNFGMPMIGPAFRLPVFVIFTTTDRTLKALAKAGQLASSLQTRIEIIAVQAVPFMLPLDEPPVPFEFVVRRLKEVTENFPVQLSISAYLCRDPLEALKCVLDRNCPVVMGIHKRWLPTRDEILARKLCHAGYNLISVEAE